MPVQARVCGRITEALAETLSQVWLFILDETKNVVFTLDGFRMKLQHPGGFKSCKFHGIAN